MKDLKHDESVMVFTCKDKETLLKFNGSQSWVLNAKRVAKCKYLICTRNSKHPLSERVSGHAEGFLVGRVSNVSKSLAPNYADRWIIEFDEYAEICVPNMWEGWQNPVRYRKTDDLSIDFEKLDFQKVPERDHEYISEHMANEIRSSNDLDTDVINPGSSATNLINQAENSGLTISEAKSALSLKYDLPVENIEIILKG